MCDELITKICEADNLNEKLMKVEWERDILIKTLYLINKNQWLDILLQYSKDEEALNILEKAQKIIVKNFK